MTNIWTPEMGPVPADFTGRVEYKLRNGRDSHYYALDGAELDGVTSIIKGGMPCADGLERWKTRQMAAQAADQATFISKMSKDAAVKHLNSVPDRNLQAAADRGTAVHAMAEAFAVDGELPDTDGPLGAYATNLMRFFLEWEPEFIMTEEVVFHEEHLYAGTMDAIVILPELGVTILDYKTSKRAQIDHALQLAAYRYSSFALTDDDVRSGLPPIESAAVVLINEDRYQVIPVDAGVLTYDAFLRAQQQYRFVKQANSLLGRPLDSPLGRK